MKVTLSRILSFVFFHDLPEFKQKVEFVKGKLKKNHAAAKVGIRHGVASFLS